MAARTRRTVSTCVSRPRRCCNIEDHDLVGALRFVPRRLLGGVAGVAQILETDAFDNATVFHVEAGNDPTQQARRRVRGRGRAGGRTIFPVSQRSSSAAP